MRPPLFSGHGGALGEARTKDTGRLGNTAMEPRPGVAPVRVVPPAEGYLRGWEVNPPEVRRQPWPGLSPGAPWKQSVTGGGAGDRGGQSQSREWVTGREFRGR